MAAAPVIAGTAAAQWMAAARLGPAVLALLVALFLQIGVNYANDYSDGVRGTDDDRVGPLRLTGSGAASPREVKTAAFVCFGLAALAGITLVVVSQQWWLAAVGVLAILAAWGYTGGFSWFQRDRKIERRPPPGLWGAPLLGMAFGLGWAPCIGPTFAAVQALVYVDGASTGKAVVLTTAYCLGLGVPFVLIALALRRGMGAMSFFRRHRLTLQRVGGAVLVLIGAAMATGVWSPLVSWVQSEFVTDWVMPI